MLRKIGVLAITLVMLTSVFASAQAVNGAGNFDLESAIKELGIKDVSYVQMDKKEAQKIVKPLDKIPSNAHYDKFAPNIYFVWDAKQKDDGYLVVYPGAFEGYRSFNIYVKCSNDYQYKTIDMPGVYSITKNIANGKTHNINMIWIGQFQREIPPPPDPNRYVLISNRNDNALNAVDAWYGADSVVNLNNAQTSWGPAPTFFNNAFSANTNYGVMKSIQLGGNNAVPIWNTDNFSDPVRALSGDVVIFEKRFDNRKEVIDRSIPITLYVAGDNAFMVFVNGSCVLTSKSLTEINPSMYNSITLTNYSTFLDGLSDKAINCQDFQTIHEVDIRSSLKDDVENVIIIVAINESSRAEYNGGYRPGASNEAVDFQNEPTRNPACAIFSCEFYAQVK